MIELKPCPYCGLSAKYNYGEDWYEINCLCGYSFQHSDTCYRDETPKDAMIRSWNTRPIEDALRAKLDAAKKAMDALWEYRKMNTLNFQLEKMDAYIIELRHALSE